MTNPYRTQEPPELLWLEQINFVAVYLGAISYGVNIAVTTTCIYYLFQTWKKRTWIWLTFTFVLFGLATLNVSFNMAFSQDVYIDNREYPGGPLAYLLERQNDPILIAGNSLSIVSGLLTDGLLIYRCHAVYRRWWILPIPVLAWLSTIAFGILFTLQASHPGSSLWANSTLDFSVPYFSIIMALNVTVTMLLVGRLLYMRHKITRALGAQHGRTYTNIATILLESAASYGIISLIFVIPYGLHKTTANVFIPLFVQIQAIAPTLIILRVARGTTWTNETVSDAELTKIRFQAQHKDSSATAAPSDKTDSTGIIAFRKAKIDSSGVMSQV